VPRDFQGHGAAQVLFHQGQAQVDPGGYTGRRPHGALLDENRVGLHRQRRELARQLFTACPVRRHATAVEQATGRQQKSPGTHRGHAPGVPGFFAHPVHQRQVFGGAVDTPAAGDEQGVARRVDGGQRLGHQRQAGGGHHRRRLGGDHRNRVGQRRTALARKVVGRGEHLQGPGHVEHLGIIKSEYMNDARHVWRDSWVQWRIRQSLGL